MPHIRLEYTTNMVVRFNFDDLFHEMHQTLNEMAGIHIENCKSRAIPLHDFYIGSGHKDAAFVHLDINIMERRTSELQQKIGNALLFLLQKYFSESVKMLQLQITVEIHDIQKALYFKHTGNGIS